MGYIEAGVREDLGKKQIARYSGEAWVLIVPLKKLSLYPYQGCRAKQPLYWVELEYNQGELPNLD